MKKVAVAIDGPSGAGKSTIARTAAKELGFIYVDTGAMYRTIGFYMYENGIDGLDVSGITAALKNIKIELQYRDGLQRVLLNGRDVSDLIRTPVISRYASDVSVIQPVRDFLLDTQRDLAKRNSVIMDGRDIGTVILPDADVKFFLTASAEKRAERRFLELQEKGEHVTFEEVLSDMRRRDEQDTSRNSAPLRRAEDAILLDTSEMDLLDSIRYVISLIQKKTGD